MMSPNNFNGNFFKNNKIIMFPTTLTNFLDGCDKTVLYFVTEVVDMD